MRSSVWLTVALLVVVTVALYWPATSHDFVNYDDPAYVTNNAQVQAGLTWQGLVWAFGQLHGEQTYWHPLTWVSHMLDCQLFGLKPAGHHLVNLLCHTVNTILVFLVFRQMTGAVWRCAVLAALFGLHPLQVDTVAWVAERKNLLGALFWLLTMWGYSGYVEAHRLESKVQNLRSRFTFHVSHFYLLSLFCFVLGLMCKPVLVTLPFVLLLLDYWPLGRLRTQGLRLKPLLPLVWEKLPFFALAAASSLVTLLAHHSLGSLETAARLPLDLRLENALVSYLRYLGKVIWPSHLAVFYPYPEAWPAPQIACCVLLLLAISALVARAAPTRPYLFVGWFWFLGVLVPFIGLIQAGTQAMADRFAYVPLIGLLILLIWGTPALVNRWRCGVAALPVAAVVAILLCLALTRQQLGHWRDSETLFRHALEVTEKNTLAHNNLGKALLDKGRIDEAIRHFRTATHLDYAFAYYNLGLALDRKGQAEEAIRQYQEAIRLRPDYADAHNNLGAALFNQGRIDEAIRQYQDALRLKPDDVTAHYNLGAAFAKRGQDDDASHHYHQTIRLKPDYADAHYNLGVLRIKQGRTDDAIILFQKALQLKPDYADAHNNLGSALGGKGQLEEAIRQFREALRLKPDLLSARNNLRKALLDTGQTNGVVRQ
jgi:tetratricopeptide (TPR) repeat protein